IPARYWSVTPADDGEHLNLTGAVLVRVVGRQPPGADESAAVPPLSPELVAALEDPPSRPTAVILRMLGGQGRLLWLGLAALLFGSAGTLVLEALLLRGAVDVGRSLSGSAQPLQAAAYLIGFLLLSLLLELRLGGGLMALGR